MLKFLLKRTDLGITQRHKISSESLNGPASIALPRRWCILTSSITNRLVKEFWKLVHICQSCYQTLCGFRFPNPLSLSANSIVNVHACSLVARRTSLSFSIKRVQPVFNKLWINVAQKQLKWGVIVLVIVSSSKHKWCFYNLEDFMLFKKV